MSFETLDQAWKTSSSATHVYFVSGPFSQWYRSAFSAVLPGRDDLGWLRFNCAEQFMMAGKASLFGDAETLQAILRADTPMKQKALGREVRGFDEGRWSAEAREIVVKGNLAKFGQNPDLLAVLLATGAKTLVEGAHYDPVWGVALAWDDPKILDETNWQGRNWLGECLMRVRDELGADVVARLKAAERPGG